MTEQRRSATGPVNPVQARANPLAIGGVLWNIVFIALLFFVNKVGLPGNLLFGAVAVFLMLKGFLGVFQAVSILALVVVGNSAFVTRSGTAFAAMKFGLLALAAGCLLTQLGREKVDLLRRPCYRAMWVFTGVAIILALIIDNYLMLPISKALSFAAGFTVVYALYELAARKRDDTSAWFVALIAFITAVNVVALVRGTGFNFGNGRGTGLGLFAGAFYHPQTLGPACALMIVYLVSLRLYNPTRSTWLTQALIPVLMGFLFLTRSRTGAFTLAIGLMASVGFWMVSHRRDNLAVLSRLTGHWIEISIIACCLGFVFGDMASNGQLRLKANRFIVKRPSKTRYGQVEWERVFFSRSRQVELLMDNISEQPLMGLGFGVWNTDYFKRHVTMFSAPTEKGFLPLAIVEETGLIGAIFFFVFIVALYRQLLRDRNGPGIAMLTAMLGANMGEMMFFSFGGGGMLMWVLVSGGLVLGVRSDRNALPPPA